jgi:hypothetical protein
MAEQLRLDATVVDKFSKPLGELRAKMQAVSKAGQSGRMEYRLNSEFFIEILNA